MKNSEKEVSLSEFSLTNLYISNSNLWPVAGDRTLLMGKLGKTRFPCDNMGEKFVARENPHIANFINIDRAVFEPSIYIILLVK